MRKIKLNPEDLCPCGSGSLAKICCLAVITGQREASAPEQLMRSRYTAYAYGDSEYILASWHYSTRPAQLDPENDIYWTGLKILYETKPSIKDDVKTAYVEFIATFRSKGVSAQMHERSRFVFEQEKWFYVDGEQLESATQHAHKQPGRNDPCYCGSGRKFKKCCGKS